MEIWLILALVGLLAILLIVWGVMRERQRDTAMQTVAGQLNFTYERDGRALHREPFMRFSLFQAGRRQRMKNLMQGKVDHSEDDPNRGIEVFLFDYRYVTGSHRDHHNHQQTVAAFHTVGEKLPEFSLQPENVLHKIGGLLGYQDIDFEHKPIFSGRYLLRGPDEAAIRELFKDDVLDFFEKHPGWCVEAGEDWIVVFRKGRRTEPERVGEFVQEAFELCTMLAIQF
ncbi:MAG: hypothetical protein WD768_14070 [Phycisphaeraceae bacterium]